MNGQGGPHPVLSGPGDGQGGPHPVLRGPGDGQGGPHPVLRGPGDAGAAVIARLRANGLTVTLSARGGIQVRPLERVTREMDRWIRTHRDAMADELRVEQAAADAIHPGQTEHTGPLDDAGAETRRILHLTVPYTRVPNVVFELPVRLSLQPTAFAVLLQLCRLTYGMQRADLSTSVGTDALACRVPASRSSVIQALHTLEQQALIQRTTRRDHFGRTLTTIITLTLPEE